MICLPKKLTYCAPKACLHYRSACFWFWWLSCWIVMYNRFVNYNFFSYCSIPLLSDSTEIYMVTGSALLWITLSRSHQVADSWFPHTALCYQPGNKCFFTVLVCVVSGEKGLRTLHESGSRLAFIWCVFSSLADCSSPCFLAFPHVELHFLKDVFIGFSRKILFCFYFYFYNTTCMPFALSTVC